MKKVSIVIPAYNEERRIGKTLEVYSNYFSNLNKERKIDYEILVVINNTKDRTEEIVKKFIKKDNRIRYLNFKRGGKGFSVIEGFKEALKRSNSLIGFVDADMATLPEVFYELITNINRNDCIIASRYLKGAIINPKPSLGRIIVSRIFNFFIRSILFLPYRDTQCGAKLFTRETIEKIISELTMSQWAFDVDLIYTIRRNSLKIREFPTKWSDKEYSKINFIKAGPWMLLGIIRLRLLHSPLRRFIKIYDKFIGFIPK